MSWRWLLVAAFLALVLAFGGAWTLTLGHNGGTGGFVYGTPSIAP